MFKIVEVDQRSEEWHQVRLGKWTASNFDKCVTPTGKVSASSKKINVKLVAEIITGQVQEGFSSPAMDRGKELEAEAFYLIKEHTGIEFKEVGFIDSELGYGCSPDGIDLTLKTGCEIKCPLAHTHVEYLLSDEVPSEYIPQIQGSMLVTGYDSWWFISYHPDFPLLIKEVRRDEKYIESLKKALIHNCNEVKQAVQKIKGMEL